MKEDCGCCDGIGIATPVTECNPPGLSAISYRAGTFATFYETMLARLSNLYLDVPALDSDEVSRLYPLRQLTARDTSDASIALLDAWAVIGDVLTFYQERIANEGYLPTAIERRSILELARLIGYRMRPGVSASVYLAFTASLGFAGTIPAGARAQSIPGTGETPQFFETSEPLDARDIWNAMKPRLTRPQFITPHDDDGEDDQAVTDVAFIDTVYLDGVATNMKTGDAVLFLFGNEAPSLRLVEAVEAQPDFKRTEIAFVPNMAIASNDALQLIINKATYLFPGSTLAQNVAGIITSLQNNLIATPPANTSPFEAAVGFIQTAFALLREQQAIAKERDFSRVAAWIEHVVDLLRHAAIALADQTPGDEVAAVPMRSALDASPLRNLVATVSTLSKALSVQPANSLRLGRTIGRSFASDSDIAPRLLTALKPAVSNSLYPAWRAIAKPADGVEAYAMRAKATLFASRYTGPATAPSPGGKVTYGSQPKMSTDWPQLLDSTHAYPAFLPLDSTYDQIKPGTWIAVDRPYTKSEGQRVVTYHMVTEVRTVNMDTKTGYAATVTGLTLTPGWLTEFQQVDPAAPEQLSDVVGSTDVLHGTIVHAQAELMSVVEEPIDADVASDAISLDGVYDGLEAGRWVIVSGNRTDIPNVSGVKASELAMLAEVSQGTEPPMCTMFPAGLIPFTEIKYTTAANAQGDRLVVGVPSDDMIAVLSGTSTIPQPAVRNQQYCQQVELAPGFYANAYVPTEDEINGLFGEFFGLLTDPDTNLPLAGGNVYAGNSDPHFAKSDYTPPKYFAWRISQGKLHTTLKLAAPLAYTYDTASVVVYGNVVKATHGQTVGEVLGDGNAAKAYQAFALRQAPLTYVSAPTAEGTSSTLKVTVNDIEWHERDNLLLEGASDRTFVTRATDDGKSMVVFGDGTHGARAPTGTANIKATYRYGIGAAGNVRAEQISQLATQPLGAQGVINPLPASGGADRDGADDGRRNAPMAVMALDRLVSVKDYADFARTYAGIGKASAARLSDGRRQVVHVTVAGAHDIPIDPTSDLYNNLLESLIDYGDASCPVQLAVRKLRLLVISLNVALLPDYQWEAVEPQIRAAMLDGFGFDARALGQSAYLSEAVRTVQEIEGVSYVDPKTFDSVAEDITADELANLARTLCRCDAVAAALARPNPDPTGAGDRILAAELVFLTPDIADTLILTNIGG